MDQLIQVSPLPFSLFSPPSLFLSSLFLPSLSLFPPFFSLFPSSLTFFPSYLSSLLLFAPSSLSFILSLHPTTPRYYSLPFPYLSDLPSLLLYSSPTVFPSCLIPVSFFFHYFEFRDLPLKINQWANVVRWEMRTRPFLRR